MATATKYSHDDVGAPVLNGTAGSLITLLDAILVNGYGSKPAAGWTQPFTTAGNVAVYRNSLEGTGTYIRIDDNAPADILSGDPRFATILGFSGMSDLNTGTDQFPTAAGISTNVHYRKHILKSAVANTNAVKWWAFATNKSFYLHIQHGSDQTKPQRCHWYFVGDFIPELPDDTNNFVIMCRQMSETSGPSSTAATGEPYNVNIHTDNENNDTDTYYQAFKQGYNGSVGTNCETFTPSFSDGVTGTNWSGADFLTQWPDSGPYEMVTTPFYLVDVTATGGFARGRIPALHFVHQELHETLSFVNADPLSIDDINEGPIDFEIYHTQWRFDFDTSGVGSNLIEVNSNEWP